MNANMTTGDIATVPTNIRYTEVTDPDLRAAIVAHAVRLGKRPAVGTEIGFSQEIRQGDAEEAISATGEINVTRTKPISEKVWMQITVTQADIEAAHALINSQKINYREAGGKVSQMYTGE